MDKVTWFIGGDIPVCTTRKTKSIYLYRVCEPEEGTMDVERVARFSNYGCVKKFASEFNFPISEAIKKIIEEN